MMEYYSCALYVYNVNQFTNCIDLHGILIDGLTPFFPVFPPPLTHSPTFTLTTDF